MQKWILFIILGWLIGFQSSAQEPFTIHITEENGLNDNEIYCLFQDTSRYLWIGGNNGLFKYNGRTFNSYTSSDQVATQITDFRQDKWGRIWCHDFTNHIYYIENEKLIHFKKYKPTSNGSFPTIYIDSKNRLWTMDGNLFTIFQLDQDISQTKEIKTLSFSHAREIEELNGKFYTFTLGNCVEFSNDFTIKLLKINGSISDVNLYTLSRFFKIGTTDYFFNSSSKLIFKKIGNEFFEVKKLSISDDIINFEFINSRILVLTRKGCYLLDENFDVESHILDEYPISDVIKDHEGGYWFSSLSSGIFFVPNIDIKVYTFEENNLKSTFNIIEQNGNTIYLGTFKGDLFEFSNNKLNRIFKNDVEKEVSFIETNPYTGEIFFGNDKLLVYNPQTRKTKQLGDNPNLKHIQFYDATSFFTADPIGITFIKLNDSKLEKPPLEFPFQKKFIGTYTFGKPVGLFLSRSTWLYFNKAHKYIIASTKNGLIEIRKEGIKPILYKNQPLICGKPFASGDSIWIPSLNNGLLLYINGTIQTPSGILSNISQTRLTRAFFSNQKLLVLHDKGLFVFDLKTNKSLNFGKESGLFNNQISGIRAIGNRVFLSTNKGLFTFNIAQTENQLAQPELFVTSATSTGKISRIGDQIILKNATDLTLSMDVVSFKFSEGLNLFYRFPESDSAWIRLPGNQTEVDFSALPFGEYPIEIKGSNKLSHLETNIIRLNVSIVAPFYRTIWFQILLVLTIMASLVYLFQARARRNARINRELLEKERINKELKSSMLASIKSQMNPHFIFNALNTIQGYVLSNDRIQANFYIGKFSDLMRKILNMSTKDVVDLEDEIESLKLYLDLEKMRFDQALEYELVVPDDDDLLEMKIPSMIIQPFVENAIKHGLLHKQGLKKLTVVFEKAESDLLKVVITDNGIGRKAAEAIKNRTIHASKSFSSDANKRRLELLNESRGAHIGLTINDLFENGRACGTEVILNIPME